jgi:hypothetical protein
VDPTGFTTGDPTGDLVGFATVDPAMDPVGFLSVATEALTKLPSQLWRTGNDGFTSGGSTQCWPSTSCCAQFWTPKPALWHRASSASFVRGSLRPSDQRPADQAVRGRHRPSMTSLAAVPWANVPDPA